MLLEGDEQDTMRRNRATLTTRVTYEETAPEMDDVTAEAVAGDIGRLFWLVLSSKRMERLEEAADHRVQSIDAPPQ